MLVKIANIAQIVNVIAPILTRGDDMLLQTIFYPFAMYASRRDGIATPALRQRASLRQPLLWAG